MGNLPRSRPGRRSSKRDGGRASKPAETTPATEVSASGTGTPKASGAGKSAAGRPTAKKAAPRRAPAGGRKTTAAGSRAASRPAAPPTRDREEQAGGTDPVTGAVLLAGKVVEGGLKVAGGIIKRLPRP
jgi:hypothetical protein